MAGKVYRTSKGQALDIGSLLLQNENTRAVGNMGVNARGDKISSGNQIIKSRNEQMTQHYEKTYNKHVKDEPVYKNIHEAQKAKVNTPTPTPTPTVEKTTQVVEPTVETTQVETAPVETKVVSQEPIVNTEPEPQKIPLTGLAGAIAKARSVEQEEEKTARQLQQEKEGVKRI